MHSPFLFSSAIPPYFTVILRLPPAKSKLFRPIKFDKKRRLLLFTHVCPATGFCRCYAFQIGKICCRNCIVRNFQFKKFLPVNSYKSTRKIIERYFSPVYPYIIIYIMSVHIKKLLSYININLILILEIP